MTKPITFVERIDSSAQTAVSQLSGLLANAAAKQETEFGTNNVLALDLARRSADDILATDIRMNHKVADIIETATDSRVRIPQQRVTGRHI